MKSKNTAVRLILEAVKKHWSGNELHSLNDILNWVMMENPSVSPVTVRCMIYKCTVNQQARGSWFPETKSKTPSRFMGGKEFDLFFKYKNRRREELPINESAPVCKNEPCLEKYDPAKHGEWEILIDDENKHTANKHSVKQTALPPPSLNG